MEKALPLRISLYKSEQKKHVSFTEGTSHEHTTRGENEAIQATPNTRSMKLPRDSFDYSRMRWKKESFPAYTFVPLSLSLRVASVVCQTIQLSFSKIC
jgi:hypothetical protein